MYDFEIILFHLCPFPPPTYQKKTKHSLELIVLQTMWSSGYFFKQNNKKILSNGYWDSVLSFNTIIIRRICLQSWDQNQFSTQIKSWKTETKGASLFFLSILGIQRTSKTHSIDRKNVLKKNVLLHWSMVWDASCYFQRSSMKWPFLYFIEIDRNCLLWNISFDQWDGQKIYFHE